MGARVFLSAVSSEFGAARRELRRDFGTRRMDVATQEELSHLTGAQSLLQLLENHIRDCTAVVCVIGSRSGAGFPTDAEAADYAGLLPPEMPRASYTQWEFLLARKLNKPLIVLRPHPDHPWAPDVAGAALAPPDDAALQAAFIRHIETTLGVPRNPFSSMDELCRIVMRQPWVLPPPEDKPVVLPYPSIGTLFKGREDFMDRLRASLTRKDGGAAAIRAVAGMGGVGKSRAAVEYAWAHRDDYAALLWLEAETGDKLQSSLAALVGPLRLPEQAAPEQAVRVEAALGWLNANPGWFLILDNVDTPPALDAAHRLMGRIGGGHVVLTSRLGGFPEGVEVLDLDVLTLPAAAALLLEASAPGRRTAPDDEAQAEALAQELGQLALALTIAAATIRMKKLSLAQYREIWRGNRARVVGWAGQAITGYHHAVAETWQGSVDQLTPPGRRLLERLAFLAPEPVPSFLLERAGARRGGEDLTAALDDLAAYSLLTREADGTGFSVHRLVQDVTRRGLAQAGAAQARLTEALYWMTDAFEGDPTDARKWERFDQLAPHAARIVVEAESVGDMLSLLQLTSVLATYYWAKALYVLAEPLARRALAMSETARDKDSSRIAAALNNLATLLRDTNRSGEAESLLRRALAIDEKIFGKDHPSTATVLDNLGQLLQATNRLDEAEPFYRRALAIDEASLGKDHPNVAIRLNNLGNLLAETMRFGEAEIMLHRSLAIAEANVGRDHPDVAAALSNLALLLNNTGRASEAEPLFRRALAIDSASLGGEHPVVAIRLYNLAALLYETERLGEAEPLMRRALAIDEASLGKDHPNVALRLNNLARLLQDTNRLSEAEPLMRRALAILIAFQRTTGHAYPHRDTVSGNYTRLLAAMGKSEAGIDTELAALHREAGLETG